MLFHVVLVSLLLGVDVGMALRKTDCIRFGKYASLFACAAVRPILYSGLQSDDSKFLLSLLFCFFRRADSDFLLDEKAF